VGISGLTLRDFRNYDRAELGLGERLTVVVGPNGAGKTNLLEALYFGCTASSPRTSNEREVVRRGQVTTRVTVTHEDAEGEQHLIEVGFTPGEPKRMRLDGAQVQRLSAGVDRPLLSVFLPDRLALVKGPPSPRRAHLDHLVAALWPARSTARAAYSQALAQRNALLARVRSGATPRDALAPWERTLAGHGIELMGSRAAAAELLEAPFREQAAALGLPREARLSYRPRSGATEPAALEAELRERRGADIERGFTAHGPHRDDLRLMHGEESMRSFGSQGQQRVTLLALLLGERDLLERERGSAPVMLLDDVMSELDGERRELLAERLTASGQALLTATGLDHVPIGESADVTLVEVGDGALLERPDAVRRA
jgi:DNA replication and repair protein RecF